MQIFGSSHNQALFRKNILSVLEEAGMDYMKALPSVEVYLGAVFAPEAPLAKEEQIYETEMESYYELYGEKAVAASLKLYFWQKMGRIIQRKYLPPGSPKWEEVEGLLGRKLDFAEYYMKHVDIVYIPAVELIIQLFGHAIAGDKDMILLQMEDAEKQYVEALGREVLVCAQTRKKEYKLNPHAWRKWFYSLWGQSYEWGAFQLNHKTAEANGKYYQLSLPPRLIDTVSVLPAKDLLEAHDYRVCFGNNGKVEYWR